MCTIRYSLCKHRALTVYADHAVSEHAQVPSVLLSAGVSRCSACISWFAFGVQLVVLVGKMLAIHIIRPKRTGRFSASGQQEGNLSYGDQKPHAARLPPDPLYLLVVVQLLQCCVSCSWGAYPDLNECMPSAVSIQMWCRNADNLLIITSFCVYLWVNFRRKRHLVLTESRKHSNRITCSVQYHSTPSVMVSFTALTQAAWPGGAFNPITSVLLPSVCQHFEDNAIGQSQAFLQ